MSLWVALEAYKANIYLQTFSIVTKLKEKQSKKFLPCLILRTLACREKFSMVLRTGLSPKSDNMGGSILRASAVFSKWFLNF